MTNFECSHHLLRNKETQLDVFRWQQCDHGFSGDDVFPVTIDGVVNKPSVGRMLTFLRYVPSGAGFGGFSCLHLGINCRDGIYPRPELGGLHLSVQFVQEAQVPFVGESGAVIVLGGVDLGRMQFFLPGQFEAGKFCGGARLIYAGLQGGKLAGA